MDKETLSNYGWIVICVLVLAVMLAFATPFGNFIADAIKSTAQGLFDTNQKALQSANINIMQQEFETMLNGNNGAVVPDGFTYTDAITGEVLGSGQQLPSKLMAGSQLTQTDGDYIYTLMKTGFESLEEARAYYRRFLENQSGMTWSEILESVQVGNGWSEEDYWVYLSSFTGTGLTEDTFVEESSPEIYMSVAVKDRAKTSYGVISSEVLGYDVKDMSLCFCQCVNMTSAPVIPNTVNSCIDAFYGCINIRSVGPIGSGADVELPNGITRIDGTMFAECTGLTNVTILSSVKYIDDEAFRGCTSLTSISYAGTMNDWGNITFGSDWNFNSSITQIICSDGTITL